MRFNKEPLGSVSEFGGFRKALKQAVDNENEAIIERTRSSKTTYMNDRLLECRKALGIISTAIYAVNSGLDPQDASTNDPILRTHLHKDKQAWTVREYADASEVIFLLQTTEIVAS
ncbi:MAG: hypothetical protein NVSMB46_04010 [Candidatus Saccharimonadales bacterium]